ncbi:MAG: sodium-dependent transporter [Prevotella sp.]|nr:sodium-dependent transporter [Prevotella sp.]
MAQSERANFGSKLGIILATAGSAVGLGNVWRFPYMTGQNGGATFIIIYVCCILLLGIPCMVSEFIIGRRGASNMARAYYKLSKSRWWMLVGCLGVLTGFLITSYYAVVSGWCFQYVFASLTNSLHGTPDFFASYFDAFEKDPLMPVLWAVLFLVLTHFIIIRGVRGGIEKAAKMFMPTLFILLLVIVVSSCLLPGAEKGIAFLFKPDFSNINSDMFLGALGQAFYSLSIAMGCICTYASYFNRRINLMKSAVHISVIDTVVAILAGLMIFPAAFSVGISPDSGASLVFITLPNVFHHAFANMPILGYIVALAFFALLSLAALTSLISLHEVSTAFVHEELHISRKRAAIIVTISCAVIGTLCSLSLGKCDFLTILGRSMFDFFDFFTGQIMLPIVGFFTCLLVGWYLPRKMVRDEFTNDDTLRGKFFNVYIFCIRYICPICIMLIFLYQLGFLNFINR